MEETEDQRDDELSSLSAIFPEIARPNENDAYTFTLELPVNPSKAVTVFFEAASEGNGVDPTVSRNGPAEPHADNIDSHELSHLPPVFLQVSLPPTYPTDQPPLIAISTSPSWLPPATAKKLKDDCTRLWEELGRDLVVFTYIDHVQQSADDVFGLVTDSGALEISPEHKIAVLDHDIRAKQAAFEKGTFDCGVCLGEYLHATPQAANRTRDTFAASVGDLSPGNQSRRGESSTVWCYCLVCQRILRSHERCPGISTWLEAEACSLILRQAEYLFRLRLTFSSRDYHMLTILSRSEKGDSLPSYARLWARLLQGMLTRLLQQCNHRGSSCFGSLFRTQLCQTTRYCSSSSRQETAEAEDIHQP